MNRLSFMFLSSRVRFRSQCVWMCRLRVTEWMWTSWMNEWTCRSACCRGKGKGSLPWCWRSFLVKRPPLKETPSSPWQPRLAWRPRCLFSATEIFISLIFFVSVRFRRQTCSVIHRHHEIIYSCHIWNSLNENSWFWRILTSLLLLLNSIHKKLSPINQ